MHFGPSFLLGDAFDLDLVLLVDNSNMSLWSSTMESEDLRGGGPHAPSRFAQSPRPVSPSGLLFVSVGRNTSMTQEELYRALAPDVMLGAFCSHRWLFSFFCAEKAIHLATWCVPILSATDHPPK